MTVRGLIAIGLLLSSLIGKCRGFEDAPGPDEAFSVMRRSCLDCQGSSKPKGEMDLSRSLEGAVEAADLRGWERVIDQVELQSMPPGGRPKPSAAEAERLARWASGRFAEARSRVATGPGRVTLRLLDRSEYNKTIRDLVGVKLRQADAFPSDDVEYGFDNIGDVLTVPPVLMGEYLAAAEKFADRAIVVAPLPVEVRFEVERLGASSGGEPHGDWARTPYSEREFGCEVELPADGEHSLGARAFTQQAAPEPAAMAFKIDGEERERIGMPAVESRPAVYAVKVRLTARRHRVAVAFLNDFFIEANDRSPAVDRNLVVDYIEVAGPIDLEPPPMPASDRKIVTAMPGPSLGEREAAWLDHRTVRGPGVPPAPVARGGRPLHDPRD